VNNITMDIAFYEQRIKHLAETMEKFPDKRENAEKEILKLWIYNSNALDAGPVSYDITEQILDEELTQEQAGDRDYWEVIDHLSAIVRTQQIADSGEAIGEGITRELHHMLFEHSVAQIASSPNSGNSSVPNEVVFIEPRRGSRYSCFREWEDFVQSESFQGFNVLKQAVRMHLSFLDLQPFSRGNGRVARLLMNLILMRNGYPPAIMRDEKRSSYLYYLNYPSRFMEMLVLELNESFDIYYKDIPSKHRMPISRESSFPVDHGQRRKRSEVQERIESSGQATSNKPDEKTEQKNDDTNGSNRVSQ
jgi:cell filamentation protein, protein adenylyltransferase